MSRSSEVVTIYTLAQRPGGVSCGEAAQACGCNPDEASPRLRWMSESRRLMSKPVKEGRTRTRYFADPEVSLRDLELRLAAEIRARKAAQVKASNLSTKGMLALPRGDAGPRVEWRVIDGRRVKVTVCPAGKDTRFSVNPSEVAPLFGCLGFGRYLQRDTAIARAYGSGA